MLNKKNTMKAVVLEKPCTADELKIQNIEIICFYFCKLVRN